MRRVGIREGASDGKAGPSARTEVLGRDDNSLRCGYGAAEGAPLQRTSVHSVSLWLIHRMYRDRSWSFTMSVSLSRT
jgi:hypothetical protein